MSWERIGSGALRRVHILDDDPSSDNSGDEGSTCSSRSASPEPTRSLYLFVGYGKGEVCFKADLDIVKESTYFAKYIREPAPSSMALPYDDVEEIRDVLSWLHRESIDVDESIPEYDITERQSWVREYLLASKYGIEAWCNAIIDAYSEVLPNNLGGNIGPEMLRLKRAGLKDSPLRKMLLESLAWRLRYDLRWEQFLRWPANRRLRTDWEFRDEVIVRMETADAHYEPVATWGECHWHVHDETPRCGRF